MNVEETLQAIAQSQLRAELRADRADRRMDQFDKKLDVTRRLVQQGMKIVIDLGKTQKELAKSQKELDFKFNALIDAQNRLAEMLMRKGTNGRR